MNRESSSGFDLETLEPRILLSAEGAGSLAAGTGLAGAESVPAAAEEELWDQETVGGADQDLSYSLEDGTSALWDTGEEHVEEAAPSHNPSPASQLVGEGDSESDNFEPGLDPAPDTEGPDAAMDPGEAVSESGAGPAGKEHSGRDLGIGVEDLADQDSTALTGLSTSDHVVSWAELMIATLHGANAPPLSDVFGQSYSLSASVGGNNTMLSSAERQAILDGLQGLVEFGELLSSYEMVAQVMPFIGFSIGETLELDTVLETHWYQPVANYLQSGGAKDSDGLLAVLASLDTSVGGLEVTVQDGSVSGGLNGDEVEFHLTFEATRTLQGLPISIASDTFGSSGGGSAMVDLEVSVFFDVSFGVLRAGNLSSAESFFMRVDQMRLTADVHENDLGSTINIGFLGADLLSGNVNLDADLDVAFANPDQDGADRITLAELLGTSLENLITLTPTTSQISGQLAIEATLGNFSTGSGTAIFLSGDPFSVSGPTIQVAGSAASEVLNFTQIGPAGMTGVFEQVGNWLGALTLSEAMGQSLPYTQGSLLGELIPLEQAFQEALTTHFYGEPGFYTFGNAQELASLLASLLNVDLGDVGLNYDPSTDRLSYRVELEHTFEPQQVPLTFASDLGPVNDLTTASELTLTATGTVALTVQVQLTNTSVSYTGAVVLPSNGRLSGDAAFELGVNGLAPVPVVVSQDNSNSNRSQLIADINQALADAGLGNVTASLFSNRLRFTANGPLAGASIFIVSPFSGAAVTELGLTSGTVLPVGTLMGQAPLPHNGRLSDNAMFEIRVGNGPAVPVTVAQSVTSSNANRDHLVTDVANALSGAGVTNVTVTLENNVLKLMTTGGQAGQALWIGAQEGNVAATELGFAPELIIEATTSLDHVYVENVSLGGIIGMDAPSIQGSALFGFVGIQIFDGQVEGDVTVSVTPKPSAPKRLTDLFDALQDAPAYFTTTRGGTIDGSFQIGVDGGLVPLGLAPIITFEQSDLFDPGTVAMEYLNLGDLPQYANLDFDHVRGALTDLGGYLDKLTSTTGHAFNQALPFLNRSLADLLGLVEAFDEAVEAVQTESPSTLQAVGQILEQAMGPGTSVSLLALNQDFRVSIQFLAAPLSQSSPIDLDLGRFAAAAGGVPNLAGVTGLAGNAMLNVTATASLDLIFGFDLGAANNPRAYLHDSSDLTGTIRVVGTGLDFGAAMGALGIRIDGGTVTLGIGGSPGSLLPATMSLEMNDTPSTGGRHYNIAALSASLASSSIVGEAHATLPVDYPQPGSLFGIIDLDIGSLGNVNGTTSLSAPDFAGEISSIDLLNDLGSLADGLDQLLAGLDAAMKEGVLGLTLPVVGDGLAESFGFIEELRAAVVQELNAAFNNGSGPRTLSVVENALTTALQNLGLIAGGTQVVGVPGPNPSAPDQIQFNVMLSRSLTASQPVGLDLGIPGLGLEVDPNSAVSVMLGYTFDLRFGVSRSDGVYFDTSAVDELSVELSVSLDGLNVTGQLGFLIVDIADSASDPSAFSGTFTVDLQDPVGAGKRLTLNELLSGSANPAGVFDARLDAVADVNLLLVAGFGDTSELPSLAIDFHLGWVFAGASLTGSTPVVEFNNVRLNLGEFLSGLVQPVLNNLTSLFEPLEPFIDVLTARLPVISDLLGRTVTILDVAKLFGNGVETAAVFIEAIADILDFADSLQSVGDNVYITLGSFDFSGLDLRQPRSTPLTFEDVPSGNFDLNTDTMQQVQNQASTFYQASTSIEGGGFSFPVVENPAMAMRLLFNEDIDLFLYDMPRLNFTFQYTQFIPVYAFFGIRFGGSVNVTADFAFGYDTYGVRQFAQNPDNPLLLFDGFYVADWVDGMEVPEASITGKLLAGAGADVGLASVFVDGGIFATLNFDLNDDVEDGKFRGKEILDRLGNGVFCLFDIFGEIGAFLSYEIEIGICPFCITVGDEIVRVTMISFEILCEEPPVLADLAPDGTLTLNMGPRAGERLHGDTTDGDESFIVTRVNDDIVLVEAFGFTQAWGAVPPYNDPDGPIGPAITRIVADAGNGRDWIEIDADLTDPVELKGGPGDDVLVGGSGNDHLEGGAGYDKLFGGDGADTLYGHSPTAVGDDRLKDTLYGGNGNDALYGDGGNDVLMGENGDDDLYGGPDDDHLYGGAGQDELFGQGQNDVLLGGDQNDLLDGGAGEDLLFGGLGDDQLEGGQGADIIAGEAGSDIIYGHTQSGAGDDHAGDTIYGGFSPQTIPNPEGDVAQVGDMFDIIYGQGGPDRIFGQEGPDLIYGGAGDDDIRGGSDDDIVFGGTGNDIIRGESGADTLHGDENDDTIYGGTGADTIYGEDGHDRLHGDSGDDFLFGENGDDTLKGGTGADTLVGGAGQDVIRGQEEDDQIFGQHDDDTLFGDDGDDLVLGHEGDDFLHGGRGRDRLEGGSDNDVILGGDHRDHLFGEDGQDVLAGNEGDDFLDGGAGVDDLFGNEGNDILHAGSGLGGLLDGGDGDDAITGSDEGGEDGNFNDAIYFGDRIVGGAGNDRIWGLGGADHILGGLGDDEIDGGAHGDWIQGEAGHDRLYGGFGQDRLEGGVGDDLLDGGADADELFGGDGDDNLSGGGGTGDDLQGGDGDDVIRGSDDGADTIAGGPGRDRIYGMGGNDVINGGSGDDIIDGGAGDDFIEGGAGSDLIVGGADHDTIYGHSQSGVGDDNAVDYLYGDFGTNGNEVGSGRDRLFGQGGNDYLYGEGEDDLIQAGAGSSHVIEYGAGESGTPGDFVTPSPTPNPVLGSVTNHDAEGTVPFGVDYLGRWTEFGGSASVSGVSGHPAFSLEPSVAAGAGGQYVAWADARNGNFEIFVLAHAAGAWQMLGASAAQGGVSQSLGSSRRPSLTLDSNGQPVVAWTEFNGAASNIYVAGYDPAANGGSGGWVALGNSLSGGGVSGTGGADHAVVVSTASGLVVAWEDDSSGTTQVYAKQFSGGAWVNLGAGSSSGNGVSGASTDIRQLSLATNGTRVAAVWTQRVGGVDQIYLREYNAGVWNSLSGSGSGTGISGAAQDATAPAVAYHAGSIFVAWEQDRPANVRPTAIYVARFNGSAWVAAGSGALGGDGVSNSEGVGLRPQLASNGGRLHLVWVDETVRANKAALYARVWNGSAFAEELPGDASGQGISETGGETRETVLAVDPAGRPYVAWEEAETRGATEIFFRGNTWDLGTVHQANSGTSVQSILNNNNLGLGDVIYVAPGTYASGFSVTGDDAGVLILGAPFRTSLVQGAVTVSNIAQVVLQRLAFSGGVTFTNTTDAALANSQLSGTGLVLQGGTNTQVLHNRITNSTGDGLRVGAGTQGLVAHNSVRNATTALRLDGAFDGWIYDNELAFSSTGVNYNAAAALRDNRIHSNQLGVAITVTGEASGLGYVGGAWTNDIFANDTGVDLADGTRMRAQHIRENSFGVTGGGLLGGDDFDTANLIENNGVGVEFDGTIQFNRIAFNETGILAMSGQRILHNLIYRNTDYGVLISGQSEVVIANNTFYAPTGDNVRITAASSAVDVRSNIMWAESGYNLYVANDSQTGFSSDYNTQHVSGTGRIGYWTKDFVDLLDWQADIARFDLHSIGRTVVHPEWSEPAFANRRLDRYEVLGLTAGQRFSSPTLDSADPRTDVGQAPTYLNLLANAGFESGLSGWTTNPGAAASGAGPVAFEGQAYFAGGNVQDGFAQQIIDLLAAGYTAGQLDGQDLELVFGARLRSLAENALDRGQIRVTFLDGADGALREELVAVDPGSDAWTLAGDRVQIPVGARKVVFRLESLRVTGLNTDAYGDNAFVYVVNETTTPNQGAYGHTLFETSTLPTYIALRFPDLYVDWERDKPLTILWDTLSNTGDSPVRIELYQDDPAHGPGLLAVIAASTPDDGEHIWIPSTAGVDFGTYDLRIRVSLVNNPTVHDRSTESFTVPESGTMYYVDDGSDVNDEYTPTSTGSNRHTGKLPSAPKPNPVNVFRVYAVTGGATVHVDTGNYPLIVPLTLSGSLDLGLGLDEGFHLAGPTNAARTAALFPAVPGQLFEALVEINDADFVTVRHLSLRDAERGVWVHNGSDNFDVDHVTVHDHTEYGLRIDTAQPTSVFTFLTAYDNGFNGIFVQGAIGGLTDSLIYGNGFSGANLRGQNGGVIEANIVYGNDQHGLDIQNLSGAFTVVGSSNLAAGRGNVVYDNRFTGIEATGNVHIYGNTVRGPGSVGIRASSGDVGWNVVEGVQTGISGGQGIIANNRVYHNGIGLRTASPVITGNVVYSNTTGIELQFGADLVANNLIYANSADGLVTTFSATGQIVNNTFHQTGSGNLIRTGNSSAFEIRNNIFSIGDGTALRIDPTSQSGITADYNLFHSTGAGRVGYWQNVDRATLQDWRNASTLDENSLWADPRFVNPAGADGLVGYGSQTQDGRDDDFHLQGLFGSFHGGSLAPVRDLGTSLPTMPGFTIVNDANQSPGIDRANPSDGFVQETPNNGGYRNLGAYGNTAQASRSPAQFILLVRPDGGESVIQNSTFTIRWHAGGFAGNVDLAYSSTGLGGPFITLAANEANDGSYDWVVDAGTFAAGDNYALRIRSTATPAIGDVSSAVFRVGIPITAYYVDDNSDVGDEYTPGATGNDANDGLSPFTPKASIRAILEAYDLEPGNIIYVDTGMYALTLNIVLAAQDSGVVIQGPVQGGHEAVLDRGNNSSFGSNYIFEFTGADNVTIAGLSLTNSRDAIFASTSADSDGLTIAGNRIYDNYEGISLSTSNDGVTVQGNEVFDNNSFGIRVDGLELAIENNVAYGNQDGVVLFGGASTGIVAGNDIYANSRWGIRGSGTVLITQNTVHDHTANNSSGINGGRDVVANVVYGNVLGISGGTNIVGNRVFANDVGMTGGTWVVGNTIYSNGIGARNPSSSNGGFVNNVVYDNTDQGVLIQGGSSLKIRNNTFYQPQGQAVRVEGFSSNTVLANNIMVVENDFAVWVAGTSQAGFSSDYNLYHLSGSGRLMQWGNAEINGLLDLFLTVGLDRNSLAADPQFVSPAGADGLLGYDIVNGTDHGADDDFHLAPGSPGVDRGDPFEYYLLEPTPQGGRINLGAYGNTPEATVSAAQFVQVTAPDGQEKLEEGEVYEIRWRTGGLGPYDVAMLMNVGNISASFDYGNEGVWMYHNFQTRGGNLGNTSSLPTVTGPDPAPANVYRFYAQGSSGVGNGLSYDLPVPDGEYVLVLHFVEPSFNGSGSRRFDIVLEGDVALANYDVFAEAGARFRGYGEALPVTVSDGNGLQIDLNNLTSVGAVLSGIELRSVNPGGMASPTVALEVSTDAGASWLPIASGQSMNRFGQGSYSWNAGPQTAGSTALVRITADQGSMPQDTSDDFFSIGPAGQLYYVNDGSLAGDEYTTAPGDNTNTGKSPDRPLASLSAVLLSYDLEPGDIILVDTGTYGVLSTIFILEEDAGVTVRGPVQAGHAAVLDGNGIPYVIELNRGHDVTLDHLTLTNAGVGVGWNSSLETSDRVTISNSEIYGTTTGVDFAIGGNEARVLNSVFYQNSTGVRLAGINTEIIGNEVFDNSQIGLNAGSATVRGNVVYDNGADGIRSGGIVENNVVYGHNGFNGTGIFGSNTARNNVVYDNRVGITGVGTVEGNRVFGNAMQGIVGGSNAAVRDNVVYSNDIGIQLNSAGTASGNLVYDNATAGLVVNLGARIVGNTIHAASGDAIRLQSDDYELRNNILWASTGYVIRAESGPAQLESDYNLYFAAGSARMALWEAHEFVLLEDWRFEIGVDAHSRMADPLFVEPAGLDGQMGYDAGSGIDYGADDDFHLQAGSPGIDAADPLSYFLEEPGPNGGRANLGFYGNTAEAATSTERFVQILTPNGWERFEQGQTVPVEWHVFGLNDIDTVGLINVGGPTIASGSLGYWLEDRYRVGGGTSGNTLTQMIDLSGTDGSVPEAMYQSYAQTGFSAGSVLGYALPVADGAYQVRLHFVEPSFTTTGLRLFDIQLQGDVVRSDFDIVEEAGARRKAVSVSFDVTAQAGEGILLELVNQANGALLSGIEITQVNPDGSANAAVALAYSANQGAAWTELAGGLLANRSGYGTYDWTVGQTTAGFAGLLRVQGAQFPNPTDVSDHAFLVANNGNVYYVNDGDLTGDEFTSAAGDNYHSGKSPDRPMASLQALLLAYDLDYGDTIFMDTGVYVLLGNVRFAGQDSGVRVQGPFDLNHAAVLDRNRPATPDTAAIQIVAADDIVLDRLEVLGGWYGIWSDLGDSGARLAVTNSQVHNNNNSGIYLRGLNADALIEGNGVFNNGTTTAGVGIQGGSDAVVRGNDVFGNATGIFVPSGLVENNVVHDNTSLGISASGITTIRGNVVFGQTGSNDVGIFVGTGSASHRVVVQDNRVFDNQIGLWNNSGTGTVIFENNRVYRNLSVGIQSGLSTIIRGNAVYSNPTGILLNGFSSAAKVHNNLLYGNTNQAMLIQRGNGHELVNNTVYQGVGDALKIETGARGIVVANNIIWVELGLAINLASNSQTDFVGDYNLFYLGASGTGSVGMWNGALQASLASWQSASGQGANSLTGNPMFVDIDGPDNVLGDLNVAEGDGDDDNFGLLAGSPAIDAANAFLLPSETDQIGQGRRDDPSTPDTGIGWPEYTEQNLGSSLYADAGELPSSGGDPLVTLPFTFTFYGQDYDQMRIARRSGFVQFGNTSSSGFTSDNDLEVFRQSIRIAPLWDHHMLGSSNFEGVYLDDTVPGEYTVRWSGVSAVSGGEVNFSLTLFANGDIRFDYGEGNQGLTPLVGISAGNGSLFVLSAYDGQSSLNQANSILWTAQGGLTYFDRGALEFQGSSADTTPPQVTGIPGLPASGGFVENAFTSLQIFFDEAMDAISARSPGNYELRGAGLDGAFDTTDDVLVVLAPAYSFGSDRVTLQLTEGVLAPDQYRLTLSGSRAIYDTAGNPLDGDANGLPGGDYVHFFTATNAAPVVVSIQAGASDGQRSNIDRLQIVFSEDVSGSLGLEDFQLLNLSTVLPVGAGLMQLEFDAETGLALLTFPGYSGGQLPAGNYRLTVLSAGITDSGGLPMAANVVLTFHVLGGDANGDRVVNELDLFAVWRNLALPEFQRDLSVDVNGDGQISQLDLDMVRSQYLGSLPPSAQLAGMEGQVTVGQGNSMTGQEETMVSEPALTTEPVGAKEEGGLAGRVSDWGYWIEQGMVAAQPTRNFGLAPAGHSLWKERLADPWPERKVLGALIAGEESVWGPKPELDFKGKALS